MAAFQNFRGAINGFNREDVVNYIARLNHDFETQVNRLNNELNILRQELEQAQGGDGEVIRLKAQLEEALDKNEQLEQELEALRQNGAVASTSDELETYRRAERTERAARERVSQMYARANGILADATSCTDQLSTQVDQVTEQVIQQLAQLKNTITDGANAIRGSAAAMYALKPVCDEEA